MGYLVLLRRGLVLRLPRGQQQERLVQLQGQGQALAPQLPLERTDGPPRSQEQPPLRPPEGRGPPWHLLRQARGVRLPALHRVERRQVEAQQLLAGQLRKGLVRQNRAQVKRMTARGRACAHKGRLKARHLAQGKRASRKQKNRRSRTLLHRRYHPNRLSRFQGLDGHRHLRQLLRIQAAP